MSGPGDGASHCGQVTDDGRTVLVFLVLILDLVDLQAVVMEQDCVF